MNPKYNIVAPVGAFGNHIRWLVLLDHSFKFNLTTYNEEKYKIFKGSSWPEYADLLDNNIQHIDSNIIEEMTNIFGVSPSDSLLKFDNLENKLNSIKQKIYPPTRTWHNWMEMEWTYRNNLNKILIFGHLYDQIENKVVILDKGANKVANDHKDLRTLILTIDPKLALRALAKFVQNYNQLFAPNNFYKFELSSTNEKHHKIAIENPNNIKLLNVDILFNKTLDRDWYQELISWFELEDLYEQANFVHGLWFDCNMRAEQEVVGDLQKMLGNLQEIYSNQ